MKSPSQHLNPTSVEICVNEIESILSVFDIYRRMNRQEGVRTVDELHMTVTGSPVNVVAKMSFATTFVAGPYKSSKGYVCSWSEEDKREELRSGDIWR